MRLPINVIRTYIYSQLEYWPTWGKVRLQSFDLYDLVSIQIYLRSIVKQALPTTYINHSRHLIPDRIHHQSKGGHLERENNRIQRSPGIVVPSSFSNRPSGSLTIPATHFST